MVWNHLAAILYFSGPLFYIGLWMLVDPAGITRIPEWVVRGLAPRMRAGNDSWRESAVQADAFKMRTAVRVAGLAVLLLAIAI